MADGKFVDFHSISHFAGWALLVGYLTWLCTWVFGGFSLPVALDVIWGGTIVWEAFESWLERRDGSVGEPYTNRLIGDPICNTLGGLSGWLFVTYVWL